MRVNYICPDDLLAKVDERAKQLSMTRTAYINMAVSRQLEYEDMIKNLPAMIDTFNNAIAESKRIHK